MIYMDDYTVIEKLIVNNRINSHYKLILNKDSELNNYIINRYIDSESTVETIYRIYKNIDIRPICKNCGNKIKFISGIGFRDYCSVNCSKKYINDNKSNVIITDDIIKNDYKDITKNKLLLKYIKEHGYEEYLNNRYNDSYSYSETIYRICNNIEYKPKCKICGNPVKLKNLTEGFDDVCSTTCKHKYELPTITDEYIKTLISENKKISTYYKKNWRYYDKILEYLKNKFNTLFRTYEEALYMLINDINEIPKCQYCGKPTNFKLNRAKNDTHYTKFCSKECYSNAVVQDTVNNLSKTLNLKINIIDRNNYEFINACNIHKTFTLTHNQLHNRCKLTRFNINTLCPICTPEKRLETNIEKKIKLYLTKLNIEFNEHDRTIISPKELDFYIEKYKIAIECNGMFWHSEKKKDCNYHIIKKQLCNDKNITLFNLWEYDINNNENYIYNILNIFLNKIKPILIISNYEIKIINNNLYSSFKNKYGLNKHEHVNIKLGLFYNDELIYILSAYKTENYIRIVNIISKFDIYVNNVIILFFYYIKNNISNKLIKISVNKDLPDIYNISNICTFEKTLSYYFYYNYKHDVILNKKYNKKIYNINDMFKCYTTGLDIFIF